MSSDAMRRCLEECDVVGIRALWARVAPHLPAIENDAQTLVAIHCARTETRSIAFKLRAYSHRWLTERGLSSFLPDELRPRAERLYPRTVEGTGISINYTSSVLNAAKPIIERVVADDVEDLYAARRTDPELIRSTILSAKRREEKRLFGRTF